jgi:hypothetical protein
MQLVRAVFLVVMFVLVLAKVPPAAAQESTTQIQLSSSPVDVGVGEVAQVAVEVRDARGLYGIDITVGFDPAIVEVIDADPRARGVQVAFGTFLDPGLVVRNVVDNEAGVAQFVMTQLNPSEPKSGSGTLIVLSLRGKQPGTAAIRLNPVQLAQRDGMALAATVVPGEVRVATQAVAGPTATPIPTQSAGTPVPTMAPVTAVAATATPEVQALSASPTTVAGQVAPGAATVTTSAPAPPAGIAPTATVANTGGEVVATPAIPPPSTGAVPGAGASAEGATQSQGQGTVPPATPQAPEAPLAAAVTTPTVIVPASGAGTAPPAAAGSGDLGGGEESVAAPVAQESAAQPEASGQPLPQAAEAAGAPEVPVPVEPEQVAGSGAATSPSLEPQDGTAITLSASDEGISIDQLIGLALVALLVVSLATGVTVWFRTGRE